MRKEELEERIRRFQGFDLDGGHPALDFTNTVEGRGTDREHDWLAEPADLAAWGHRAGLLSSGQVGELERSLAAAPEAAARLLAAARQLREALFRLFRALMRREDPPSGDLRLFNDHLRRALAADSLLAPRPGGPGTYWLDFSDGGDPAGRFLISLLRQAAELLATVDPGRLKICSTPDCGWLFIDTSRNGSRRWCDMASCGNRAKVKRFYQQRRNTLGA